MNEQKPQPVKQNSALAASLIKRADALKAARSPWDSFCQDVARYVMPRKAQITSKDTTPNNQYDAQLFDNTAIMANQILANGTLAWMTPHESSWFAYEAEDGTSDELKQWLQHCTRIARTELAKSNFYSEIHENYLDRGAFGTACTYAEEGRKTLLQYTTFPMGTYSLAEDSEKLVDTCFREFRMTARQAAQKFGSENLSEALQKVLAAKDEKSQDEEHEFLHAIYPRDPGSYDPTKLDAINMPIASCYLERKTKHLCRESGYQEMPFAASRYLKWGDSVYGWSPAWIALPDSKQVNFLEKNMDALAEISAFPRILLPSSMEGLEVDMRAGGATFYDGAEKPSEWGTQGRYDVGLDRANRKRQAINDAFHVDLFRMFANLDKQMTAREVAERSSEKLIQFSPTFARMTTEMLNPLLERTFMILLRAGAFPPPPAEIQQSGVLDYKVSYSSRIALAISAQANNAFARTMEIVMPLAQSRPDILDNYDMDKIVRDVSRNDGMPADWILAADQVAETRKARAQQQAQMAKMQQMSMMADAAAKAGSIPAGSPMAQQLDKAQQAA
jgi:hypothetical protein